VNSAADPILLGILSRA